MMSRQAEEDRKRQRLDRLAGDGSSVVGIDLAALFRVILNQIQDAPEGAKRDHLTESARIEVSNHARIEYIYGSNGADPWVALIEDALAQLESTGFAERGEDGRWRPTPKLVTDKRLVVIPRRVGKHSSVGVVLYSPKDRERRGVAEQQRMEVTSLAARMREDGPGLRPVAGDKEGRSHLDALEQSMRDFGWRPEFPVIVDQHGRILDGRHRREAAKRAGVSEPPPKRIRVASDEEAVGFAILVNLQRGWTPAERNRINHDLKAAGLTVENFGRQLGTAAKRELIKTALLENPKLSHNAIAKRLGISYPTVDKACADLIVNFTINECSHRLTEDGKQAPGPKPNKRNTLTPTPEQVEQDRAFDERVIQLHDSGLGVKAIAEELGVAKTKVQTAYEREGVRRSEREAAWEVSTQPADTIVDKETEADGQPISETPSWKMVAELFRRLSKDDQAAFMAAVKINDT